MQGGDCAEAFVDCCADSIQAKVLTLCQMSLVVACGTKTPVVRIARMAGQYMKPRSKPTEDVDGTVVCSYKGDSVNSFDLSERAPNPDRLLQAYFHSTATLNFTRGLLARCKCELPALKSLPNDLSQHAHYPRIVAIAQSMEASAAHDRTTEHMELFTSHEGLLLAFEEALTREERDGVHYNLGAHFLWIGDRTRQIDGAHVEYFRGIANPIGLKVGPTTTPAELAALVRVLNPLNIPGKLTLITRLGASQVSVLLPPLVKAVTEAGVCVVWQCDPMHGNTVMVDGGVKTRHLEDIFMEIEQTFAVHRSFGTWLGGVHFELTGEHVTECVGGLSNIQHADLVTRYESFCDPRLNQEQSVELAYFLVGCLC